MNQKRKIGKRIASWLLCLAMVLSIVNLPAFTTTVHAEDELTLVSTYDELYNAVSRRKPNIKLTNNIRYDCPDNNGWANVILNFGSGSTTIDLNNYTLDFRTFNTHSYHDKTFSFINIYNSANVTIRNGSIMQSNGKCGSSDRDAKGPIKVENNATLNLENVSVENKSNGYTIYAQNNATVNISGGEVITLGSYAVYTHGGVSLCLDNLATLKTSVSGDSTPTQGSALGYGSLYMDVCTESTSLRLKEARLENGVSIKSETVRASAFNPASHEITVNGQSVTKPFFEGTEYQYNISADKANYDNHAFFTSGHLVRPSESSLIYARRVIVSETAIKVSNVSANVTAPVAGAEPQSLLPTAGTGYTFTSISWYEKGSVSEVTGNYEGNTQYWVGLYVEPTRGYELAPAADLNVKINGANATVRRYDGASVGAFLEFTFPATEKYAGNVVTSITANITAPVAGARPQSTLPTAGTGYAFASISWYEKGSVSAINDSFEAGEQYWVGLYVVPTDGYELALSEDLTFTVNGVSGNIRRYDGSFSGALLEFTFPTTPSHIHSGGTATCTKKAVCENCGKEYGELNPGNHDFSKCVSNGDGTHKVMCKDCDTVQEGHDKDACSGGKATCTKKAVCDICGGEYGKLAEHTLKTTTTTKATLTADGKKETKCTVCGKVTKTTKIYAAKTVKLSKTTYTYDGKAKKPTVTIKDSKGKAIATTNYSVKYDDGRKNVGKYNVKITFKGDYKGSKTLTFTINPKATTLKSVTPDTKAFTAKWTKQTTQVDGYEVEYALDDKFTSSAKKVAVTKNITTSKKISSLKAKKTYYVRVRTYKKVGTKKYYSDWSKVLSVKTK